MTKSVTLTGTPLKISDRVPQPTAVSPQQVVGDVDDETFATHLELASAKGRTGQDDDDHNDRQNDAEKSTVAPQTGSNVACVEGGRSALNALTKRPVATPADNQASVRLVNATSARRTHTPSTGLDHDADRSVRATPSQLAITHLDTGQSATDASAIETVAAIGARHGGQALYSAQPPSSTKATSKSSAVSTTASANDATLLPLEVHTQRDRSGDAARSQTTSDQSREFTVLRVPEEAERDTFVRNAGVAGGDPTTVRTTAPQDAEVTSGRRGDSTEQATRSRERPGLERAASTSSTSTLVEQAGPASVPRQITTESLPPERSNPATLSEPTLSDFVTSNSELTAAITAPRRDVDGSYQVTAVLNPPALGQVEAVVKVIGSTVTVSITAHTPEGHQALSSHLDDLQHELATHGTEVHLSLSDENTSGNQRERQHDQTSPTILDEADNPAPDHFVALDRSLHVIL